MYLAAIADAQPQAPTMPPQMAPHPAMQHGGHYMQHPQAVMMAQQPGLFPQKVPLQFGGLHQLQDTQQQQQQHQQAMQGQMGLRPIVGANNGMHHPHHPESTHGSASAGDPARSSGQTDARGGSKQDSADAGGSGTDGQGNSAAGRGSGGDREETK